AMGYLIYQGIQSGGMYYLTVSEFLSQKGEFVDGKVRVNGSIVPGSVIFDSQSLRLDFVLKDTESSDKLKIVYRGAPPDLIEDEGVTLVAEGFYNSQEDIFAADNLLVKCPSKYEKKQGVTEDITIEEEA
ncbi:MAG: cytochrome c maturation protein CcmE, partial [Thermodesulfobacteriota bacterium]